MLYKIKLSLILLACGLVVSASGTASAEPRSPVVGKGNVVSKRAYLSRTWGRSNAHKARINFIRARTGK